MAATHDSDATLSLGPLATPARPAVGVPDLGFAARYQLGARLAEGGLAIIYDAHDVVLDRKVAIKQLRDPDPGLTARFLREARLTSRLVHPGIVPIYDLGSDADGVLSYAMKWIAGRSLAHELAARPTLEARLALVPAVIAIAEAVAYSGASGGTAIRPGTASGSGGVSVDAAIATGGGGAASAIGGVGGGAAA